MNSLKKSKSEFRGGGGGVMARFSVFFYEESKSKI